MELVELIMLGCIGLFAGLVGGMLGVGGSIVMIPAMTELLGPNQHLYQAAAMIVNFFVVVPAVYQHRRVKAIDRAAVLRFIPLAAVSVVVGVGLSELPLFAGEGEAYLRGLFGLFLLFVAVSDLYRLFRRPKPQPGTTCEANQGQRGAPRGQWRLAAAVAIPTGLVSGLLGVGGGILAVPLQRRFLNVPMRTAVANSATVIIATSLIGASVKNYAYLTEHEYSVRSFVLAAVLIPTAIIGSLNGSKLTHRLPLKVVKAAFFVLLLVAAIRLTYQAVHSLPSDSAAQAAPSRAFLARQFLPMHPIVGDWGYVGSTFQPIASDTIF
ncbi:MAG: sulfite exporter TauE/SafE family protein [Phycisphaerae bacterium]